MHFVVSPRHKLQPVIWIIHHSCSCTIRCLFLSQRMWATNWTFLLCESVSLFVCELASITMPGWLITVITETWSSSEDDLGADTDSFRNKGFVYQHKTVQVPIKQGTRHISADVGAASNGSCNFHLMTPALDGERSTNFYLLSLIQSCSHYMCSNVGASVTWRIWQYPTLIRILNKLIELRKYELFKYNTFGGTFGVFFCFVPS